MTFYSKIMESLYIRVYIYSAVILVISPKLSKEISFKYSRELFLIK